MEHEDVHLYLIDLPVFFSESDSLYSYLSNEERTHAESIQSGKGRISWITSTGLRRVILSRYLQIAPYQICFTFNQYGKPEISGSNPHQICFNTSHSQERLLLGICRGRDIGVDIQYISPDVPEMKIANRVFGSEDTTYLATLQSDKVQRAFFQIWTLKEAYCKALGLGFSLPVEEMPPMNSHIHNSSEFISDEKRWHAYPVPISDQYVASVIVSEK